jgi:hypothetical protein
MRPFPKILLALACILLLGACGDRHLTRKITPVDIGGAWQMTATSRLLLQRDGYVETPGQTYTITFHPDGSLHFASVVDNTKSGTFFDCPGTWKLQHDTTIDNSVVRANVLQLELRRPKDLYLMKLSLAEENGRLRLWSFYGDPDSWEFMEYERQPATAATSTGPS